MKNPRNVILLIFAIIILLYIATIPAEEEKENPSFGPEKEFEKIESDTLFISTLII